MTSNSIHYSLKPLTTDYCLYIYRNQNDKLLFKRINCCISDWMHIHRGHSVLVDGGYPDDKNERCWWHTKHLWLISLLVYCAYGESKVLGQSLIVTGTFLSLLWSETFYSALTTCLKRGWPLVTVESQRERERQWLYCITARRIHILYPTKW